MAVKFQDYSIDVKAELDGAAEAWLYTWANEIASQAKRNCAMDGEQGTQLRGSYAALVDEGAGKAQVGTPLEAGFWEEFGTGEYAVHKDGRKGWWIYIEGESSMGGGQTYRTQEEAESMAAYIRAKYHKNAVATNGRKPNHTLEAAFTVTSPKAIADAEKRLKGLGK